jgi:hypothetical protein
MNITPISAIDVHSAASLVFGDDDEIVQLREWGTEQTCKLAHRLPQDGTFEMSARCSLRFGDAEIAPTNIELIYERNQWHIICGCRSLVAMHLDIILRASRYLCPQQLSKATKAN